MNTRDTNNREKSVTVSLNGVLENIEAMAVANALENLAKLITEFSTEENKVRMAELKVGSAVTGVLATRETQETLFRGIETIRSDRRVPDEWSFKQMNYLKNLTGLANNRGADSVSMSIGNTGKSMEMDADLRAAIDSALDTVTISIGSASGKLIRYHDKGGSTFEATLDQEHTNKKILLRFDEDHDQSVRTLLRKNVEARGIVRRHPSTNKIERIELRAIREIERPTKRVSGYGIWSRLAASGVSGEEIVRKIRDSQ